MEEYFLLGYQGQVRQGFADIGLSLREVKMILACGGWLTQMTDCLKNQEQHGGLKLAAGSQLGV